MYGWLLESVQHYIVQECGQEIWETILREAGARNTIFSYTQQYPDDLMLRLASSLALFTSRSSDSVYGNNSFKCPFSDKNVLTAVAIKQMNIFTSPEELRSSSTSTDKINEGQELEVDNIKETLVECPKIGQGDGLKKISLKEPKKPCSASPDLSSPGNLKVFVVDGTKACPEANLKFSPVDTMGDSEPTSSNPSEVDGNKRSPLLNSNCNTSCTMALNVYKRQESMLTTKPMLNTQINISGVKLNTMKEKLGTPEKAMHFFGRCFVKFLCNYGYDKMIRATGRYFCTFLQSVDNIHQRMRYSFPRMRSPSMQLTRAHRLGAEIVYSSTRMGFTHYLIGQLYEIAEDIFSLKLNVSVVKETMDGNHYVAVLRLEFDNSNYVQSQTLRKNLSCELPAVPAALLLQLFPFGVLLDRRMKVMKAGEKLIGAWGGPYNRIVKTHISEILRLRKPKMAFTWEKVECMQNVIFDLELVQYRVHMVADVRRGSQGATVILLRGPIKFLGEIDALIFLCSPIFNDLGELQNAGLYLNDLNAHGLSKEMVLNGWQHLSKLELVFEKAKDRSLSLEKSCILRDQLKKRGDRLLNSMIPKAIANHLRDGKTPTDVCEAFESVTIIFCGVQLAPRTDVMQTVGYMNDVYSKIDKLLDTHRVYKVETVGTVYMLVSGAPERSRAHAASAASAALAISRALPVLTVGVHSGPCVAGVLGHRLPRYCLVGDSVNTAHKMLTTSEPGRIQISSVTASQLPPGRFRLRRRGPIKVKGKGMMETFWLEGEIEEEDQHYALQLFSSLWGDEEASVPT